MIKKYTVELTEKEFEAIITLLEDYIDEFSAYTTHFSHAPAKKYHYFCEKLKKKLDKIYEENQQENENEMA